MFAGILPALVEGRRVIAADLQAHGRTADIDRPLSAYSMADDVAALIRHLGLGRADVMGYSMGGGVALQTAVRHPEVVRKLVVVSFPFKREGWYPEVLAGLDRVGRGAAEPMKQSPMYEAYAAIAPRPAAPGLVSGLLLGEQRSPLTTPESLPWSPRGDCSARCTTGPERLRTG